MTADPTAIVTLSEVKNLLSIPASQVERDTFLQLLIDASTRWVTFVSDAVLPETFTNEVHSGGSTSIVLFNTPIMTVTSLIEYVGAVPYTLAASEAGTNQAYGYSIDNASAGIISRRWNGFVGAFVGGRNNIVVTYKAGFAVTPADIKLSLVEDLQMHYSAVAQGRRDGRGQGEQFSERLPLSMFPRLASLMSSSRRVPAIG